MLFEITELKYTLNSYFSAAAEEIGVEAVDGNETTSRGAEESQTAGDEACYKEDAKVLDGPKSLMMSSDNRQKAYSVD